MGRMGKVQSSKFKVQSSKFKVQSSKFKVQSSKFKEAFGITNLASHEVLPSLTGLVP
jgi:hypothetical protein